MMRYSSLKLPPVRCGAVFLDVLQGREKIPHLLWTSGRTQKWPGVAGPYVASLGKVVTVLILSS